jgi:hypothetical protein
MVDILESDDEAEARGSGRIKSGAEPQSFPHLRSWISSSAREMLHKLSRLQVVSRSTATGRQHAEPQNVV